MSLHHKRTHVARRLLGQTRIHATLRRINHGNVTRHVQNSIDQGTNRHHRHVRPPPRSNNTRTVTTHQCGRQVQPNDRITTLYPDRRLQPPLLGVRAHRLRHAAVRESSAFFTPLTPRTRHTFKPDSELRVRYYRLESADAQNVRRLRRHHVTRSHKHQNVEHLRRYLRLLNYGSTQRIAQRLKQYSHQSHVTLSGPLNDRPTVRESGDQRIHHGHSKDRLLAQRLNGVTAGNTRINDRDVSVLTLTPNDGTLRPQTVNDRHIKEGSLSTYSVNSGQISNIMRIGNCSQSPPGGSRQITE